MSAPQRVVMTWQIPATVGQDSGVGQLILDVSINEQHGLKAEVTKHQVETESDITDHIRPIPPDLTIEGMISSKPIGGVTSYLDGVRGSVKAITSTVAGTPVSYSAFSFDGHFDRVRAVYGDLANAIQSAALFGITTTLTSYTNMACVSFDVPRNSANGAVLRFTMGFQNIRFVTTETVAALPGKKLKHRGAKTGKEAPPKVAEKAQTTLHGIAKSLGTDLVKHTP